MSQQELLKYVINILEEVGIDYMVTGSIVSSLQGEPRLTHDIDIIISIKLESISNFVNSFPLRDFYLDEDGVADAITRQSVFNLIDKKSGDKVDFWILTDNPFDVSRFSRKYEEELLGLRMFVSRPEDSILAKLRWAMLSGGSEKQYKDALRIYEIQYENLDKEYLLHWAQRLDVESLLQKLFKEAEIL